MKNIILFDIDGTLTVPRKKIEKKMLNILTELKNKYNLGCISGSDFIKCKEQVGDSILEIFDFSFFENGLVSYKRDKIINVQNIKTYLGEFKLKKFINYVLKYISEIDIPVKRGTFIEFRNGMINISPIGRNCSQDERDLFEKFDKEHEIRKKMIEDLKEQFKEYNLAYSIGGQISFDVFPIGWDKTYCLQFLNEFENIYFFGDKTDIGGNDYELYISDRTISFKTTGFENTIEQLRKMD